MKLQLIFSVLLLALLFNACSDSGNEPEIDLVEDIINQVSISSLSNFVNILSGETSFNYNGLPVTIETRNWGLAGNEVAADFIESTLISYGLQVVNQPFNELGKNIYAVQTGVQYPDQFYIIGAHYDDCGVLHCNPDSSDVAPGADDNASGISAVLEAARIMSNYNFKYSVIYALWDEEERGLFGSMFFADSARANNIFITGYINLDMIGWNDDDDLKAEVIVWDTENIPMLGESVVNINERYNIGLNLEYIYRDRGSDFISFWLNNYPAIGLIEDYNNFNTNYHTAQDLIVNMDLEFYHKMAKMAIGTLAYLANEEM